MRHGETHRDRGREEEATKGDRHLRRQLREQKKAKGGRTRRQRYIRTRKETVE